MAPPISTSTQHRDALWFDIAIGEALFASTLATLVLTGQVASGRLSHDEADAMLDGATLVLERHRGADPNNAAAVDYARDRLNALMNMLHQLRP